MQEVALLKLKNTGILNIVKQHKMNRNGVLCM